jgi:cytochrome b561
MSLTNTRAAYGWAAIALHWISAIGVAALYFLGDRIEDAPGRVEKLAARDLHVSVGILLLSFLAARLLWSASQTEPRPLEQDRRLRLAAKVVQILFLAMIAVLIVTGPLSVWATGRSIDVFGLFALPSPFAARLNWLHEAAEEIHGAASKLFWPLIVLHVGGALKHLVFNRDQTVQRMLWAKR